MSFFFTLSMILTGCLLLYFLLKPIRIPPLVGYLLLGILLGFLESKYSNLLDSRLLSLSSEIRKIALIIILVKAGLSLDFSTLKKVARPAIFLSFLPAVIEMISIGIFAPLFFQISYVESFLMGSVLGAVSPAVVVPFMSKMMEEKRGTEKGIPQMLVMAASFDDIIMIVFFQSFLTIETGGTFSLLSILSLVESIVLGIVLGVLVGYLLSLLFKHLKMRDTIKLLILFTVGFLLTTLEEAIAPYCGFSSLLSIITLCMIVKNRDESRAVHLLQRTNKLWILGEMLLFTFVGIAIKIEYATNFFFPALLLILISLFFRSLALQASLIKTKFNWRERAFINLSYLPKATVQAAIGSTLLDTANKMIQEGKTGVDNIQKAGEIILSVAVLSILLTAPLVAIFMNFTYKKCLSDDSLKKEETTEVTD